MFNPVYRVARHNIFSKVTISLCLIMVCSTRPTQLFPSDLFHAMRNASANSDANPVIQAQGLRVWDRRCASFVRLFHTRDDILVVRSGEYLAANFTVTNSQENSLEVRSEYLAGPRGTLPLSTKITYRLQQNRLSISYQFEARETIELTHGLLVTLASSNWKLAQPRNHYSALEPIRFENQDKNYHQALQQIYELCDEHNKLVLLFPNPYHSLVTIEERAPRLLLYWHILPGGPLIKSYKPPGPPLASVLQKGCCVQRELELILFNKNLPTLIPLAYFSPYPNGCDQIITIGLDDIPFQRWKFPLSGNDSQTPVQSELVRLLEKHPQMKMSWVMVPDAITHEHELANPDYPAGRWWRAHGKHRISTASPESYKQWLRNIDQHNVVLGYEDRVSLGSHGLHHTPEQEYGQNWEFQYYDPVFCDSTFQAIVQEFDLLGLSPASRRWIRFPGFVFTRSTIDALIKYKFVLFDYGPAAIALPWTTYLSPYGQIWGMQARWEGDTPQPFSVMDEILGQGMVCHCAGHPWVWFKNGDLAAFTQLDNIFSQAEEKYAHLGYLWPDEMGLFAHETSNLHYLGSHFTEQEYLFTFSGKTDGQSVYIEWPPLVPTPQRLFVDNMERSSWQIRNGRLICTLPKLEQGVHTIRLPIRAENSLNEIKMINSSELKTFTAFPNPFRHTTKILITLPSASQGPMDITIFNAVGKHVRGLLYADVQTGLYELQWDGLDDQGRRQAAGVYFCHMTGLGSSKTLKLLFLP